MGCGVCERKHPALTTASNLAANSADPTVRAEAANWRPKQTASLDVLTGQLEHGSPSEQRAALIFLSTDTSAGAVTLLQSWISRLNAGQVAPALQLDVLVAAAANPSASLRASLAAWTTVLVGSIEAPVPEVRLLVTLMVLTAPVLVDVKRSRYGLPEPSLMMDADTSAPAALAAGSARSWASGSSPSWCWAWSRS